MIADPYNPFPAGPEALREGYYQIERWRRGKVPVPVRIWFGVPADPLTGEPLDRSPRWQVMVGGVLIGDEPVIIGGVTISELADFWPQCARHPITVEDHDYMVGRAAWSVRHDPLDPYGSDSGRIDLMTAPLPMASAS